MSQPTKSKVPVTLRALTQRINRALARRGEKLCAARAESELGWFYVVNVHLGTVEAQHQNPEALGRDLGVLRPWETVAAGLPSRPVEAA
jgi:hypothetical protein